MAQTASGSADMNGTRSTAQLPLRQLDIPAGSVAEALRAYESASGNTVRADFDRVVLENLRSPGATGLMSDAERLARLMSDSGLQHRFTSSRSVTITLPGLHDSIELAATAPEMASPKFEQPLLDTPRTVTVIHDEVFLVQGDTTLRDVLRNTTRHHQSGRGGGRRRPGRFVQHERLQRR